MFGKSSAFRGAVIRWEVGLLLGFPFLCVVSISRSLVMDRAVGASHALERKVHQANNAKLDLEILISRIKDAETGQRGFLLTGDEAYLEPYQLSKQLYQIDIDRLKTQSEGLQADPGSIDRLSRLAGLKYKELDETIRLFKAGNRQEALKVVSSDVGKTHMDEIRLAVSRIGDGLNVASSKAIAQSQHATEEAQRLNLYGSIVSVTLLLMLFGLSWRTVHREFASRTQQDRASQELERAVHNRTEELNTAKDELEAFSYSVSHDLRGPLRAVISYASMLEEDYGDKLDDEAKEYLTRIKASGRRMSELIDTLLALSRLSRAEITLENVDVSEIAQSMLGELAKDSDPTLQFQVDPEIELRADRKMLTTLMDNLLRNAVKFSSRSEMPNVEVFLDPESHAVAIRDNGVGFNPQYANKLFLPFQRLHNDREFEGTGIGLAIVQRIVKRHGGLVWATSEEGKGATFYFSLSPGNGSNQSIERTELADVR
ncbi:MAG: CHASE3 domain-containing protein [Chlorobia bacterium]|nr:CHASE3 domain-containing protein [Fimbriimonadaceae bacterium]